MFEAFELEELRLISGALAREVVIATESVKRHNLIDSWAHNMGVESFCGWETDLETLKMLHNESLAESDRRHVSTSS
jgi:hypothetical protein